MAAQKQDLFAAPKKTKQDIVPWGPWSALGIGFGAYLGPQIMMGVLIGLLAVATGTDTDNIFTDDPNYLISFALSVGVSFFGAWIIYEFVRTKKGTLRHLGLIKAKALDTLLSFPVYCFGYLPSLLIAFEMIAVLLPTLNVDQDQDIGFDGAQGPELVLAFVSLVILAPIFEELLFRGFIFKSLADKWDFWPAALTTSVLFGLAHGQLNVAIDTFILSMFACALVWHTKSIMPAIMLHSIKNVVAYIFLFVIGPNGGNF